MVSVRVGVVKSVHSYSASLSLCACYNGLLDDLSQITICPRRYVTKRSDMYQNYMDDLPNFFLVFGQFVTLLFWTICHKSYLSQLYFGRFVTSQICPRRYV